MLRHALQANVFILFGMSRLQRVRQKVSFIVVSDSPTVDADGEVAKATL